MLRDDDGKPSAFRLAVFVCLAVQTWVIMYIVLKSNALDTWMFVTYVAIWSGAKVAETALNAYAGKGRSPDRDGYQERYPNRYQPDRYPEPYQRQQPPYNDDRLNSTNGTGGRGRFPPPSRRPLTSDGQNE